MNWAIYLSQTAGRLGAALFNLFQSKIPDYSCYTGVDDLDAFNEKNSGPYSTYLNPKFYGVSYAEENRPEILDQVGLLKDKRFKITSINGIGVNKLKAYKYPRYLSEIFFWREVVHIINPNLTFIQNVYRYIQEACYLKITPACLVLAKKWREELNKTYQNEKEEIKKCKIIHIAHSEGCIITKLALLLLKPEERKRIYVICVAPGAYIPKELCADVRHFINPLDPIQYFDFKGKKIASQEGTLYTTKPFGAWTSRIIHYLFDEPYQPPLEKTFKEFYEKCIAEEDNG